jgi:hypothetical protein
MCNNRNNVQCVYDNTMPNTMLNTAAPNDWGEPVSLHVRLGKLWYLKLCSRGAMPGCIARVRLYGCTRATDSTAHCALPQAQAAHCAARRQQQAGRQPVLDDLN